MIWRDDAMACSHWWKPPINTVGILGLSRTGGGQIPTVLMTTTDALKTYIVRINIQFYSSSPTAIQINKTKIKIM